MRSLFLCFSILFLGRVASASTLDLPAPPEDWATIRNLGQTADGQPGLPPAPGATGDLLIKAADLATSSSKNLSAADYDALYSLLQRYRDELVGLGLDYDKLMSRLDALKQKSADLKDRLDNFHPLDGAKIHGRVGVWFDDTHIMGNRAIPDPYTAVPPGISKPAKVGARYSSGLSRSEINFELTRGPISGLLQLDIAFAWAGDVATANLRRFNFEFRLPVTMQVGSLYLNLSPLTLWRNEDKFPLETEPYRSRRQRAQRDYLLEPDKVNMTALRISTEALLFKVIPIAAESITSIVGEPFYVVSGSPAYDRNYFYYLPRNHPTFPDRYLVNRYTTYMEGWKVGIPTSFGLEVSYQGNYFVDDPQSRPNSNLTSMAEQVHTGRIKFDNGLIFANAEYGMSDYAPNRISYTAFVNLTGTALTGELGVKWKSGVVRGYYRNVSSGFHSAGAQGRTQDRNYEPLGPLMTQISYINSYGLALFPNLAPAPQDRWNTAFIPAGVWVANATGSVFSNPGFFGHLLPYNYLGAVSPYGAATPNRQGFGVDAQAGFFDDLIVPKAGYESFNQIDPVVVDKSIDPAGNTTAPFAMSLARAGMDINFTLGWRFKLSGGYTMGDFNNGLRSPVLDHKGDRVPYRLTYGLLETGLEVWPTPGFGIFGGARHLDAAGLMETEMVSRARGAMYDGMAVGVKWAITENAIVDAMYDNIYLIGPDSPQADYRAEMGLLRIFVYY